MGRPGHVFVIRGDIRRLVCDAWLMPCDKSGRPHDKWLLGETKSPRRPRLSAAWNRGDVRCIPWKTWPPGAPRPWLVNMDGEPRTPTAWYLEGVSQFFEQAIQWLQDDPKQWRRCVPLIGVPLVGSGEGGARDRAGELVGQLLPMLRETAQQGGLDIALVTHDGPSLAGAQAARRQSDGRSWWPELNSDLCHQAARLAERASAGELALFLGAGVSANAGLPLWGELLTTLAKQATMDEQELQSLRRLDPLDQAAIIEKRLGGPSGLHDAIRAVFTVPRYSLTHALLAALPTREAVTTNYDQLFEMALETRGRHPSVLPHDLRRQGDGWVLKMHGCVSHPADIVLTRSSQLGYGERRAALAGIVQALLITRHMLFVGFSLNDDNFHRIAEEVRRVVRPEGIDRSQVPPFGTALVLERSHLMEELWEHDLEWVGMANGDRDRQPPSDQHTQRRERASRRLDIFLDYLSARIQDGSHLLDDRYPGVLTAEEQSLRNCLMTLVAGLPDAARQAPGWELVAQALAKLGLRPGKIPQGG